MKREIWGTLVIFLIAMVVGYCAEEVSYAPSPVVTRRQAAQMTGHILENLRSFLQENCFASSSYNFSDFSAKTGTTEHFSLAAGILEGYPDGTFRPDLPLTRGECFQAFGKTQLFLARCLIRAQEILERKPIYTDVAQDHWLQSYLPGLAGIGALSSFQEPRLSPDAPCSLVEAKKIVSTMTDYFNSPLMVIEAGPDGLQILSKGTMTEIPVSEWQYSWTENRWQSVPDNGFVPFAPGTGKTTAKFLLSHERFQPVGLPGFRLDPGMIWFMKLQYRGNAIQEIIVKGPQEPSPEKSEHDPEPDLANKDLLGTPPIIPSPMRQGVPPAISQPSFESPENRSGEGIPAVARHEDTKSFGGGSEVFRSAPMIEDNLLFSESHDVIQDGEEIRPLVPEEENGGPTDRSLKRLSGSPGDDLPRMIDGLVVDSLTKKGIPGATVLVDNKNSVTDKYGKFSFPVQDRGIKEITIYCEGFESLFLKRRFDEEPGPLVFPLNEKQAKIEGTVVDSETGEFIRNAVLDIGGRTVRADHQGKFKVSPLPPTYHQLSCQAPGYMSSMEIVYLKSPATKRVVKLLSVKSRNQGIDLRTSGLVPDE